MLDMWAVRSRDSNVYVTIGEATEGASKMALTRSFRETIAVRVQSDPRFRQALFSEALTLYLAGDIRRGKAVLRDLVNATIGFEGLAAELGKPGKSLHRMLGPHGNPSSENFFEIMSALQKKTGVKLAVTASLEPRARLSFHPPEKQSRLARAEAVPRENVRPEPELPPTRWDSWMA
jgi:DNA-binding phage protein